MNEKRVLFLISMVEEDFYNLRHIKEDIKKEYIKYFSQVENLKIVERPHQLNSITVTPMKFGNVSGHWLAANISTPSKVIDKPMTVEVLKQELIKEKYSHVCISAFLDGYFNFKKSMEYLIKEHPSIVRVLGNIGALYDQFTQYFKPENICYGDGVPFLRKLLNEPLDQPYYIPSTTGYLEMLGDKKNKIFAGVLTTSTGCPHKCDFCGTSVLFQGKFNKYNFTAEDVYRAIKEMEEKIGSNEFLIFVGEPNAFLDKNLWYSVFERFRNEKGSYGLIAPISMDVLDSYDMEKLQNSAIRLDIANIGLESVNSKEYKKNKNRNVRELLRKFESYGISVWGTFIIGFPGQTFNEMKGEVDSLIELGPTIPALLNLRPIRRTELFTTLENEGKIPSDYIDIGYRFGFMSYIHDYIGLEFKDLPKLMTDYYNYIESKTGCTFLKILEVKLNQRNLANITELNLLKFYYNSYSEIHDIWVNYFHPNDNKMQEIFNKRFEAIQLKMKKVLENRMVA